jgi:uncharacterized membrane protein
MPMDRLREQAEDHADVAVVDQFLTAKSDDGRGHPREDLTVGRALLPTLLLSIALGVAVAALIPGTPSPLIRGIVFWDTFLVVMLARKAWIFAHTTPERCRLHARADDPGNLYVFFISIIGSVLGLLGAAIVLAQSESTMQTHESLIAGFFVLWAVIGGWLLTQISFSLHYARLYYDDRGEPGGIDFHGDPPDDLDFAYFGFTIGMTFQVSDLVVTAQDIRRVVLIQALIAFFYNLAIFALVINILAGKL